MSETLALSLALFEYHCKLTNAIVHNMANIVITTISSTNVNHCLLQFLSPDKEFNIEVLLALII
jgi:hypothetical protein